jgi:hypothetical protein
MRRNKLKELTVSMAIGLLCVIIFMAVSSQAISAYLFGQNAQGEVIEYSVSRERPAYFNASQYTPERHEILAQYTVNNQLYWVVVNSHVYSALGVIDVGDTLLIAYQPNSPQNAYVINFALFNTLASILVPFILIIFLLVTPQWIYHLRRTNRLSNSD